MEALRALIEKVDDDYLTGLCNKGTVKRAYKDLEREAPVLVWQGEEAQVFLKEETCLIRTPLGESSCSCPSRSICRHIVTAVLWMKREMAAAASGAEAGRGDGAAREAAALGETAEKAVGTANSTGPPPLQELLQIPPERLRRACGAGHYRQFVAHIRALKLPPIEESSIVTVALPWEKATVKLLEPFAHSTCTCHSRELCTHKAQAALAYQIEKGRITLEGLDSLKEEASFDIVQVKQACAGVSGGIAHQLCTGLSRQSPEVSESLERLSVIAHRARLPDLESGLREAASGYRQYFARSAAFRIEELLHKLLTLRARAQKLEAAKDKEEIRYLAGTFRDAYEPAGSLRLMGMGGRTFSSSIGYEGEIYYFLETGKKEWYTWTDARPVFYEGTGRRPPGSSQNALAPWGLNCSREQMQTLEFDLQNAKAASGGRLSASQESKAEITGGRSFEKEEVRQMVAWDYEKLLAEHFAGSMLSGSAKKHGDGERVRADDRNKSAGRRERLALVGAVGWGETSFDTVQQRFSWSIFDRRGRALYISLKYSRQERLTIRMLERLEQKLQKGRQRAIIFFGSLYMDEGGRLCLFPIAFFLKEAEALLQGQESQDRAGIDEKEEAEGKRIPPPAGPGSISQYRREAVRQLSDLFASGLSSVREDTVEQISHLAKDGEGLGLHFAGREFECVAELLRKKRHQMEFEPKPVLEAMTRLDAYLRACGEKLSYDTALISMRERIIVKEEKP